MFSDFWKRLQYVASGAEQHPRAPETRVPLDGTPLCYPRKGVITPLVDYKIRHHPRSQHIIHAILSRRSPQAGS